MKKIDKETEKYMGIIAKVIVDTFLSLNKPFTIKDKTLEQRTEEGKAAIRNLGSPLSDVYYDPMFKNLEDKTNLSTKAILLTILDRKQAGFNVLSNNTEESALMIKALWPDVFTKYILNPVLENAKTKSEKPKS